MPKALYIMTYHLIKTNEVTKWNQFLELNITDQLEEKVGINIFPTLNLFWYDRSTSSIFSFILFYQSLPYKWLSNQVKLMKFLSVISALFVNRLFFPTLELYLASDLKVIAAVLQQPCRWLQHAMTFVFLRNNSFLEIFS